MLACVCSLSRQSSSSTAQHKLSANVLSLFQCMQSGFEGLVAQSLGDAVRDKAVAILALALTSPSELTPQEAAVAVEAAVFAHFAEEGKPASRSALCPLSALLLAVAHKRRLPCNSVLEYQKRESCAAGCCDRSDLTQRQLQFPCSWSCTTKACRCMSSCFLEQIPSCNDLPDVVLPPSALPCPALPCLSHSLKVA